MAAIWQDLRYAIRVLAAHRQFTIVAVSLLALGIGATTAVFSVVNAVLLRPLPYADPSRLVALSGLYRSNAGERRTPVALTDVAEWRRHSQTVSSMGAFAYTQLPVRIGDRSFAPVTALMDPQFLPTLGKPLAMGTYFADQPAGGHDSTVILSHALWVEAFGRAPSIVGQPIVVDGTAYVVRGVLAADFQFPRSDASYFTKPVDLLIPASSYPNFPHRSRQWFGIARLKPGVSLADGERELQGIAEGLARDARTTDATWSVRLASLGEETTRKARQPLLVVLGISAVLLLIAATNLMNLFFSRGVARLPEMSIRRALGSTTARLVRQQLIESLLLATGGGLLGVLLARVAVDALVGLSPIHLPVTQAIDIDRAVLAFTMAACIAAALAAGFLPALHVSLKTQETARTPGLRASAGRAVTRVQQGLCIAQIALGMALLAGAGLLAHSLWRLSRVDPGFDSTRVLGFNLSVPNDQPMDARIRFYARALEEVRSIPGVDRAGLISFLPPETRAGVFMGLAIDGLPAPERGAPPRVINTLISSVDYFPTMRIPVVGGRDFGSNDTASSRPVILVNEALVRRYFPRGDAVGRRIGTGFDGMTPVREIVGIVKDTHDRGLAAEAFPTAYIPFTQFALPYGSIALRTAVAPDGLIAAIRDRLNRLNPSVPVTDFQTVGSRLRESMREPRFYTTMAIACAGMAVLFVTFGLYGLLSYTVSRRTSELGIRMAVGADARAIRRLVLLQGLRMSCAGVVLGLALALVLTRLLRSLLFQVEPLDPMTLAASATTVVAITLAASYAPARRASRLDPIAALRRE